MKHWYENSVFYHIYPLGCAGAPRENDFCTTPSERLTEMLPWIHHMKELGITALYIGPVFESETHGYDTVDYFSVDRRLGTNEDLKNFIRTCHENGIYVILDAVFNHVGRNHPAFRDLLINGYSSAFRNWFYTDFSRTSPLNDQFWYEGWNNYYSLVKLNLQNQSTLQYILKVVQFWIEEFDIDGIRCDAADSMDKQFFVQLRRFCNSIRTDFWLMGEVIHGNYNEWANPQQLHSVTNYECYKGLWSSHNDANYFEIAYSMNRQFGSDGIYKNLLLYTFCDNHDVNRIASILENSAHFYPLSILLFTIPGLPSIYYGSESGITGCKENNSDYPLRPKLMPKDYHQSAIYSSNFQVLKKLIYLRKNITALFDGDYSQIYVSSCQYVFRRQNQDYTVIIAVNSASFPIPLTIPCSEFPNAVFTDVLNNGEKFSVADGKLTFMLNSCWGRIMIMPKSA